MPQTKKWYQNKGILIFLGILGIMAIVVIVSSIYLVKKVDNFQDYQPNNQNQLKNQLVQQLKRQKKYPNPAGTDAQNYSLGSTSSPRVTIVEFSDFECPYSQNIYSKIRRIGINYGEDVRIIFRDYPATENSLELSMAANCAGDQGLFWPMHDKLFQNQGDISSQDLPRLAQQIGADKDEFQLCLAQDKFQEEIIKDIRAGDNMNIKGTPTLFINGHKISGDIPYDLLKGIIEGLINE